MSSVSNPFAGGGDTFIIGSGGGETLGQTLQLGDFTGGPSSGIFFSDGDDSIFSSTSEVKWSSTTNPFGPPDIGLKRESAGLLKITNGATGEGSLAVASGAVGDGTDVLGIRGPAGSTLEDTGFVWYLNGTAPRLAMLNNGVTAWFVQGDNLSILGTLILGNNNITGVNRIDFNGTAKLGRGFRDDTAEVGAADAIQVYGSTTSDPGFLYWNSAPIAHSGDAALGSIPSDTDAHSATFHTNIGATGIVEVTLSASPTLGTHKKFFRLEDFAFRISPDSTRQLVWSGGVMASGEYLELAAVGSSIEVVSVGTKWMVTAENGTITEETP